jgi:hypothetical protein
MKQSDRPHQAECLFVCRGGDGNSQSPRAGLADGSGDQIALAGARRRRDVNPPWARRPGQEIRDGAVCRRLGFGNDTRVVKHFRWP